MGKLALFLLLALGLTGCNTEQQAQDDATCAITKGYARYTHDYKQCMAREASAHMVIPLRY